MCERLDGIVSAAREFAAALDAPRLTAERAVKLADLFSELEKIAAAGRTLTTGRVASTRAWRASGASSATAWVAQRAGTTLGEAAATLQTAALLDRLPTVREAFASGRLSDVQAAEISAAAAADPSSESELLSLAERESLPTLRERCRDVRAAVAGDEEATERIRRGRYLRHWTDREGGVRLQARLAPDDAAPLISVIETTAERLRAEARRSGSPEPGEAYAADALVSLVSGHRAPRAVVHVHISQTALERGHTVAGETCRIDGIGPVSVAAARRLALGGTVKVLATDGVDVHRVAHVGRTIPTHVRTALEVRDPVCVVPGCNRRSGLEIDHLLPFALGGETSLENLARLCRWHHAQKTHHGWQLEGAPGDWIWTRGRGGEGTGARATPATSRGP